MTEYFTKDPKTEEYTPVKMGFFNTGLLGEGSYLLQVRKNGSSLTAEVSPDAAPMVAAAIHAKDKVVEVVHQASAARPSRNACSPEEIEAWEVFKSKTTYHAIEYPSAQAIADAAMFSLMDEAEKLLKYPAVREAYDQFIMLCKLTQDPKNGNGN